MEDVKKYAVNDDDDIDLQESFSKLNVNGRVGKDFYETVAAIFAVVYNAKYKFKETHQAPVIIEKILLLLPQFKEEAVTKLQKYKRMCNNSVRFNADAQRSKINNILRLSSKNDAPDVSHIQKLFLINKTVAESIVMFMELGKLFNYVHTVDCAVISKLSSGTDSKNKETNGEFIYVEFKKPIFCRVSGKKVTTQQRNETNLIQIIETDSEELCNLFSSAIDPKLQYFSNIGVCKYKSNMYRMNVLDDRHTSCADDDSWNYNDVNRFMVVSTFKIAYPNKLGVCAIKAYPKVL